MSKFSGPPLLLPLARLRERSHYLVHQSPVLAQRRRVSEPLPADAAVARDDPSVLQLMCCERFLLPEQLPTDAAFVLGVAVRALVSDKYLSV